MAEWRKRGDRWLIAHDGPAIRGLHVKVNAKDGSYTWQRLGSRVSPVLFTKGPAWAEPEVPA